MDATVVIGILAVDSEEQQDPALRIGAHQSFPRHLHGEGVECTVKVTNSKKKKKIFFGKTKRISTVDAEISHAPSLSLLPHTPSLFLSHTPSLALSLTHTMHPCTVTNSNVCLSRVGGKTSVLAVRCCCFVTNNNGHPSVTHTCMQSHSNHTQHAPTHALWVIHSRTRSLSRKIICISQP